MVDEVVGSSAEVQGADITEILWLRLWEGGCRVSVVEAGDREGGKVRGRCERERRLRLEEWPKSGFPANASTRETSGVCLGLTL